MTHWSRIPSAALALLAAAIPGAARPGAAEHSPAEELPPHIRRVTQFGQRADWSPLVYDLAAASLP